MAKNGKQKDLQHFVMGQLQEAQKRFVALEKDAEKAINQLVSRGKESRKDLEKLINKVSSGDIAIFDTATVKDLTKRAEVAGTQMKKRLDHLQTRMIQASGVATQHQMKELRSELNRLAKKIDAIGKPAQPKPEVRQ